MNPHQAPDVTSVVSAPSHPVNDLSIKLSSTAHSAFATFPDTLLSTHSVLTSQDISLYDYRSHVALTDDLTSSLSRIPTINSGSSILRQTDSFFTDPLGLSPHQSEALIPLVDAPSLAEQLDGIRPSVPSYSSFPNEPASSFRSGDLSQSTLSFDPPFTSPMTPLDFTSYTPDPQFPKQASQSPFQHISTNTTNDTKLQRHRSSSTFDKSYPLGLQPYTRQNKVEIPTHPISDFTRRTMSVDAYDFRPDEHTLASDSIALSGIESANTSLSFQSGLDLKDFLPPSIQSSSFSEHSNILDSSDNFAHFGDQTNPAFYGLSTFDRSQKNPFQTHFNVIPQTSRTNGRSSSFSEQQFQLPDEGDSFIVSPNVGDALKKRKNRLRSTSSSVAPVPIPPSISKDTSGQRIIGNSKLGSDNLSKLRQNKHSGSDANTISTIFSSSDGTQHSKESAEPTTPTSSHLLPNPFTNVFNKLPIQPSPPPPLIEDTSKSPRFLSFMDSPPVTTFFQPPPLPTFGHLPQIPPEIQRLPVPVLPQASPSKFTTHQSARSSPSNTKRELSATSQAFTPLSKQQSQHHFQSQPQPTFAPLLSTPSNQPTHLHITFTPSTKIPTSPKASQNPPQFTLTTSSTPHVKLPPLPPPPAQLTPARDPVLTSFTEAHKQHHNTNSINLEKDLPVLRGHFYAFATDSLGSRMLETSISSSKTEHRVVVFEELAPNLDTLIVDKYGNFIVQSFVNKPPDDRSIVDSPTRFTNTSPADFPERVGKVMLGKFKELAYNKYSSKVVQKVVENASQELILLLLEEMKDDPIESCNHPHANYILQKLIRRVPPEKFHFLVEAIASAKIMSLDDKTSPLMFLSTHEISCRVIQGLVEFASPSQRRQFVPQLVTNVLVLVDDPYGNYIIQRIIEMTDQQSVTAVFQAVLPTFVPLCQKKYASNVLERLVEKVSSDQRSEIVTKITSARMNSMSTVGHLIQHQYGNFVMRRLLLLCTASELNSIITTIISEIPAMKQSQGWKHAYNVLSTSFSSLSPALSVQLASEIAPPPGTAPQSNRNSQAHQSHSGRGRRHTGQTSNHRR
ncbi:putative Pumilio like protein [Blattamonas nauphoetae]|uniref:Pumilio like protein n=1 Tax=Blattamonas nauphoetae TaxID=2049346 RepID=A0ABQ9XL52_9EUKA|nr:putative Pumilio like protein [Blattamonas nauphoetae]